MIIDLGLEYLKQPDLEATIGLLNLQERYCGSVLKANSSWQLDWQYNKFLDDHVNDHLSALLEVGSIQHWDICWNICDIFERKKSL